MDSVRKNYILKFHLFIIHKPILKLIGRNLTISVCGEFFTTEKNELETKLPKLKNKIDNINETVGNINEWIDMISAYENITELDREIVCGLVECVTVFEKNKSEKQTTQEIKIEYRFIKNLLQKEKEDIAC